MQHSSLFDALVKQNAQGMPDTAHLLELTKAHPYFTPAHFYLLQQMNNGDQQYRQQAAKTALLFNNPYWLQFQLQHQTTGPVKETPVITMYAPHTDAEATSEEAIQTEETKIFAPEEIPVNNSIIEQAATAAELPQAIEPAEPFHPIEPVELVEPFQPLQPLESIEHLEPTGEPEESPMPDIKIDLAASIKDAENENALNFEPMHLVDYFASQGIKLTDEIQTADKLGKQLKSFTEWLKTMKKVHTAEAETGSAQADITIQNLAEKSNAEGEIITEAMAEVFAQQGKTGKAIEVYKKLSLLNPLKSAYFAAKIEQLKGL
jgi:hypothetical protein